MEIRVYPKYNAGEILPLYESAGWTAYTNDPEGLRKGFEGSMCVLAAYEGNSLVGILRAVGDGNTIALIQDILVLPEMRRKGVGTALLKAFIERYRHVRQIQLVTDKTESTLGFYKSVGFSMLEEVGCCGLMWMGKE